jgi:tetratricopeptide (TPR) repeat protein
MAAAGPARPAIEQALAHAAVALQSGQPIEAERIAHDVLKARPQHPPALSILGQAMAMQGRAQEAVAPLEQAARSLNDAALDTQLGTVLRKLGRDDDALARFRRAVKRKPPFPAAFFELGWLLFDRREFNEAIEVLQRGVAAAPSAPDIWALLGSSLHARRDLAEAKAAFSRALTVAPAHPAALYGMGLVLMDQSEFVQAATLLRQVLSANVNDADAQLNLGVCLLELGQADAAAVSLRAATRGGPKLFSQALKALTSSGHGRFWLRPSAARKYFKGEAS